MLDGRQWNGNENSFLSLVGTDFLQFAFESRRASLLNFQLAVRSACTNAICKVQARKVNKIAAQNESAIYIHSEEK